MIVIVIDYYLLLSNNSNIMNCSITGQSNYPRLRLRRLLHYITIQQMKEFTLDYMSTEGYINPESILSYLWRKPAEMEIYENYLHDMNIERFWNSLITLMTREQFVIFFGREYFLNFKGPGRKPGLAVSGSRYVPFLEECARK